MFELVEDRNGVTLRVDGSDQSFVDLEDPTFLVFEYVQRVAELLDQIAEPGQRIRAVHVGGGALTIPRYLAHTRPTSAQIVLEPDVKLTQAVRDKLPLPPRSGIKIRATDGRTGLSAMPENYADVIIVDAFNGARVPAELVTREYFAQLARVLNNAGTVIMNITDKAPFAWARRVAAGLLERFPEASLAADPGTLKGRHFGNLVLAGAKNIDADYLRRRAASATFPARVLDTAGVERWAGGVTPFTDAFTQPSPDPRDFGVNWR
ncbi:MAG: fused MFS/spermidine synthase [Propionibacteriaceae bacterium]|nr:fused MFS/spermidine synthase [Propionibacteriaceae bacterium]